MANLVALQQPIVMTIIILVGFVLLGALCIFLILKNHKRLKLDKYTIINDVATLNELLQLIDYRIKNSKKDIYFTLLLVSIDDFDHLKEFINLDNAKEYLNKIESSLRKTLPIGAKMAHTSDEESFLVYLPEYYDEEKRQDIAQEFKDSVEKKFVIRDSIPLQKTASVAMTTYPEQGDNVVALVNNLLVSVYLLKKDGGNDLIFYNKDFENQIQYIDRYQEMKEAIGNNKINITFNPIIDKSRKRLSGCKCIVSYINENGFATDYNTLINNLEESGDDFWFNIWCLEKSLLINMDILRSDYGKDFYVVLPVNYKFIMHPNAAYKLQSSLDKYNIALDSVILEIDDILDREPDNNLIKNIMQIQGSGIKIATKINNADRELTKIIETYDIDFIKIRIEDIVKNNKWISAMLKIAHNYRKKIIITGVESEEQVELLKSKDITYLEGPYYGISIKKDRLLEMMKI